MPTLENVLPNCSPKSLNRRLNRSSQVFHLSKVKFMGSVLPKIQRAIRQLSDSLNELKDPVTVIVGKGENSQAVEVKDYNSQARIASTLATLIDHERSLLGFPGPGKRKDEPEKQVIDGQIQVTNGHDHVLEQELNELRSVRAEPEQPEQPGQHDPAGTDNPPDMVKPL